MIRCNLQDCKYNGGTFCKQTIVILHDGICQVPYKENMARLREDWSKEFLPRPQSEQAETEEI